MSRSATLLLITLLLSLAALWLVPDMGASLALLLKGVAACSAIAFLIALAIGRRYKFDPILR